MPESLTEHASETPSSAVTSDASTWDIDEGSESAADFQSGELGSPKARKSFWIGVCGLAIVCLISIACSALLHRKFVVPVCEKAIPAYSPNVSNLPRWQGQRFIDNSLKTIVFALCFLPLIPILLWRGYLGLRSFIAFTLFTNVLFLGGEIATSWWLNSYRLGSSKPFYFIAVVACWAMLYPLTQLRVWQGRPMLRSISTYVVLAICGCMSVASVGQPVPTAMVAATSVFAVSIALTVIVRRVWGLATLEADITPSQILPASLESLIAFTSIAAVFITTAAAWGTLIQFSQQIDRILWAAGFVLIVLLLSALMFSVAMNRPLSRLTTAAIAAGCAALTMLAISCGITNSGANQSILESGHILLRSGLTALVLVWILVWAVVVSFWLKVCGWTLGRRPR